MQPINHQLGNHDNKRLASRYRPARTDLFNMLLKTLPGITVTYMVNNATDDINPIKKYKICVIEI